MVQSPRGNPKHALRPLGRRLRPGRRHAVNVPGLRRLPRERQHRPTKQTLLGNRHPHKIILALRLQLHLPKAHPIPPIPPGRPAPLPPVSLRVGHRPPHENDQV